MPIEIVDVIVVGMGVAGEAVAGELADAGLDVVGIDERLVGGECAYFGCIPTKTIVRQGDLLAEARRAGVSAGHVEIRADWERVAQRVRDATSDWDDTIAVKRFEQRGGRFVRGHGHFIARDAVEVNGKSFRATRAIVIATGTEPSLPPIPGLDAVPYWTNRDAVAASTLPDSILVLGGGSVGVELAQAWGRFGAEITLVETADRLLAREEPEASELIARVLRDEGIDVRTGVEIDRVLVDDDGTVVLRTADGRGLTARQLLLATGRAAQLEDLDVGHAGLDAQARSIDVDEHLRAAPGIWAIGDVTGKGEFTHVATYQAKIATAAILEHPTPPARYHAVPRVTFTDPEVGAVGLTADQAVARGRRVRCACVDLAESSRASVHGDGSDGLVKLVVDATSGTLIGATSIGPSGGEVLSMLTLAVHAELTIAVLAEMIYAYPTWHRAVLTAVEQLASRADHRVRPARAGVG